MNGTNGNEEGILAKIAALLAKAESTTFPAEAEAFYAKAQEMMLRHAIDEEMIRKAKPKEDREKPLVKQFVYATNAFNLAGRIHLLSSVCFANRCKVAYAGKGYGKKYRTGHQVAWICGFPNDVAFCELLYTSLTLQMSRDCNRAYRERWPQGGPGANRALGTKFATSFYKGFAQVIYRRLDEQNRRTTAAAGANALVLYDRKNDVEAAFKAFFGDLKSMKEGKSKYDYDALSSGRRSGERADMSMGRGGVGTGVAATAITRITFEWVAEAIAAWVKQELERVTA